MLSLFSARNFLVILEQCGVALSTNTIDRFTNKSFLDLFYIDNLQMCIAVKFIIYCLNNCLPSRDRQPKTMVFLREPAVTVTIGLLFTEIHFFLLKI